MKCKILLKIGNKELKLGEIDLLSATVAELISNPEVNKLFKQKMEKLFNLDIDNISFNDLVVYFSTQGDRNTRALNILKDSVREVRGSATGLLSEVDITSKAAAVLLRGNTALLETISLWVDEVKGVLEYDDSDTKDEHKVLVPNGTVSDLFGDYNYLDWSGLDSTTPILAVKSATFEGIDAFGRVSFGGLTMYVVNPNNYMQVKLVHAHLTAKAVVEKASLSTLEDFDTEGILNFLKELSNLLIIEWNEYQSLKSKFETWDKAKEALISKLEVGEILEKAERDRTTEELELYKNYLNELKALRKDKTVGMSQESENKFKRLRKKDRAGTYNLSKMKTTSFQDLLLDFIDEPLKYSGLVLPNSNNSTLDLTLRNVIQYLMSGKRRDVFADSFTNDLNTNFEWDPDGRAYITIDIFKTCLQNKIDNLADEVANAPLSAEDKAALQQQLDRLRALHSSINSKTTKVEMLEIMEGLMLNTDLDFTYVYDSSDSKRIFFKNVPQTFETKFPDLIKSSEFLPFKKYFRGSFIYELPKGGFVVSKQHKSPKAYVSRAFKTMKEAEAYITDKVNYAAPYKTAFANFMVTEDLSSLDLPTRLLVGQIIEVLNYKCSNPDIKSELVPSEAVFIFNGSQNLLKFYSYIEELLNKLPVNSKNHFMEYLKTVVDDPLTMAAFIYELNALLGQNRLFTGTEALSKVTEVIENAKSLPRKQYIVENVGPAINNKRIDSRLKYYVGNKLNTLPFYTTRLIEVNSSNVDSIDAKTNRPALVINQLKNLCEIIGNKFNFPIHTIYNSDLDNDPKLAPYKDLTTTAKAFILNGQIYVNLSKATKLDVFHEYTHIFLGVLKSRSPQNYEGMLKAIIESDGGKALAYKRKLYPNMALLDLAEEVFADKFGDYLANRMDSFDSIFDFDLNSRAKRRAGDAIKNKSQKEIETILLKAKEEVQKLIETSIFGYNKDGEFNPNVKDFTSESFSKLMNGFSLNLSLFMMGNANGLGINTATDTDGNEYQMDSEGVVYRLASNWITKLLQKHQEDEKLGIEEICE